ncbi:MAG: iron-containing alcohol dehydrogenase [Anaerolineaceae bacterium]|nr:iron-containing alcohol dehydrogenase [Anaerolineaceae bacterium]
MRFDFVTASKIVFGAGALKELGSLVAPLGKHPLVVTGKNPDRALDAMTNILKTAFVVFPTDGEPTVQSARDGAKIATESGCDLVIGFGGGSALDTAKAIAALLTNPGDPLDYLEVIGRGQPIKNASAPFIAIPTTAGTGSEVTSNAVLASPEHQVKVSLRSPLMLARIALVDSTLTLSSPPDVTAQSGLDALTQVIEPFTSNKANPLTDAICKEAIQKAAGALQKVYEHPNDAAAREDMALVSLSGGLALANAKLGAVHGFAGPFGGMFDAPHGAICARLLPFVMDMNVKALRQRQPDSDYLNRYEQVAKLLTGDMRASAEEGVKWVYRLTQTLNILGLASYGMTDNDLPALIEKSAAASSMQGNPIKLTADEMRAILAAAA